MEDIGYAIIPLVVIIVVALFLAPNLENQGGNENKTIIIYGNSGETVIENPDSYRFGGFGITVTKSGERITASHYKLISKEAE